MPMPPPMQPRSKNSPPPARAYSIALEPCLPPFFFFLRPPLRGRSSNASSAGTASSGGSDSSAATAGFRGRGGGHLGNGLALGAPDPLTGQLVLDVNGLAAD